MLSEFNCRFLLPLRLKSLFSCSCGKAAMNYIDYLDLLQMRSFRVLMHNSLEIKIFFDAYCPFLKTLNIETASLQAQELIVLINYLHCSCPFLIEN